MDLLSQINLDIKASQKAHDELRLGTLRLLLASLKNKEIDLKRPLTDEEILKVLASNAKQRKDSILAFNKGSRPDLAEKEELELKILEEYLPNQLPEADVEAIVVATITKLDAHIADFGQVMGMVMKEVAGQSSGDLVSKLVKKNLK